MKSTGLQFSVGLSLACHAVGFGLYTYGGHVWRQAELRPKDLPLIITWRADSEASPHQVPITVPAMAAAPPAEMARPQPAVTPPEPPPVVKRSEPIVAVPEPGAAQPQPALPPIVAAATSGTPTPAVGVDRLSQPAGRNFSHHARPDYRRNPRPAYPRAARQRHQEGVVLLSVQVSDQGLAARVTLRQSSGFPLLDEAALQTVRHWEFEPARINSGAVESEVEVPVRFQLGN
jgi:periplasmic protein TonB